MANKPSLKHIEELEEQVIDLKLKVNSLTHELLAQQKANKNLIGKLIHNLKNPVGVIYSFSEMINENTKNNSPEKLAKYVEVINASANHSIQLLNKVAKLTSVTSNNKLNISTVNLNKLILESIKKIKETVLNKQIEIKTNIPNKPIFILADTQQLKIAFDEILDNAIKFSANKTCVSVEIFTKENSVEIYITDSGLGISNADLPLIFDEFYVVNTYSQTHEKCIGLGLAIAKNCIQNNKGNILVTSQLEKGTEFKITFSIA